MLERHHQIDARVAGHTKQVLRRFVRKSIVLKANTSWREMTISRSALVRLQCRKEGFSMAVDGARHYPAFLADSRLKGRRLPKLLWRMPAVLPSELLFDLLQTRRASLGNKSPLQATWRGQRFCFAPCLADYLAAVGTELRTGSEAEIS